MTSGTNTTAEGYVGSGEGQDMIRARGAAARGTIESFRTASSGNGEGKSIAIRASIARSAVRFTTQRCGVPICARQTRQRNAHSCHTVGASWTCQRVAGPPRTVASSHADGAVGYGASSVFRQVVLTGTGYLLRSCRARRTVVPGGAKPGGFSRCKY